MITVTQVIKSVLYPLKQMVPIEAAKRAIFWKIGAAAAAIGLVGQSYANNAVAPRPNRDLRPIEVKRSLIGTVIGTVVMFLPFINRLSGFALTRLGLLPNTSLIGLVCTAAGLAIIAIGRMTDSYRAIRRIRKRVQTMPPSKDRDLAEWTASNLPKEDLGWVLGKVRSQGTNMLIAFAAHLLYSRL
jgi:hypothetical protein